MGKWDQKGDFKVKENAAFYDREVEFHNIANVKKIGAIKIYGFSDGSIKIEAHPTTKEAEKQLENKAKELKIETTHSNVKFHTGAYSLYSTDHGYLQEYLNLVSIVDPIDNEAMNHITKTIGLKPSDEKVTRELIDLSKENKDLARNEAIKQAVNYSTPLFNLAKHFLSKDFLNDAMECFEAIPESSSVYKQANKEMYQLINDIIDQHNEDNILSSEQFLDFSKKRIELSLKLDFKEKDHLIAEFLGNKGLIHNPKKIGINASSIVDILDQLRVLKIENTELNIQLEQSQNKSDKNQNNTNLKFF